MNHKRKLASKKSLKNGHSITLKISCLKKKFMESDKKIK